MNKISAINNNTNKSFSNCYGCGLCTLVCPVWHQNHNVCSTPHGHAKALQSHGKINVTGLFDCILCGACEPVCPENIDLMQMILELRHDVVKEKTSAVPSYIDDLSPASSSKEQTNKIKYDVLLLADNALLEHTTLLNQTLECLKTTNTRSIGYAEDNGNDIIRALQSGLEISEARLEEFLTSVKAASKVIISDCLLKKALQQWLPSMQISSLGFELSSLPALQHKLGKKDLYIIECRAYNTDFKRMVAHYNKLKQTSDCHLNLDLQRLAVPTGGVGIEPRPEIESGPETESNSMSGMPAFDASKQGQWILKGINIDRIIVECVEDGIMMSQLTDKPVIHLAELLTNS